MMFRLLWIPYILIITIIPALNLYFGPILGLGRADWELVLDILMAAAALIGLIVVLIRRRSRFNGWQPLIFLTVLFIIPQLFIWHSSQWGITELRQVYRFCLLYLTLHPAEFPLHASGAVDFDRMHLPLRALVLRI